MSAYEELVERCVVIRVRGAEADKTVGQITEEMLAEILRTLEEVTPEMLDATHAVADWGPAPRRLADQYFAMLHASALQPRAPK